MSVYSAIQRAISENLKGNPGCMLRSGTVVSANPLRVQLQTGFVLEQSSILIPQSMRGRILQIGNACYRLDPALAAGDSVLMLCTEGQYLLLDRMGEEDDDRIITAE